MPGSTSRGPSSRERTDLTSIPVREGASCKYPETQTGSFNRRAVHALMYFFGYILYAKTVTGPFPKLAT
jgi:hypothetical protein